MRAHTCLLGTLLTIATSCASFQAAAPSGSDTEALRAMAREMAESWNEHDMRRFAALFMLAVEKVTVQFPTRDMGLVHVLWSIRGDRNADDTARQPRGGVFS